MIKLKKTEVFFLLAFMIMLTTFLTLFSTYASIYVGHNLGVNIAWSILWLICILIFYPHTLKDKFLFYVIVFWIIVEFFLWNSLWYNINEWNRNMDKNTFFSMVLSVSLYTYFRLSKDYQNLAILIKWTLIFIAITAAMSIYTATINPMYVRESFLLSQEELLSISKLGGGGYGFSGALVCLFPLIVYYYRNSKKIPYSKTIIFLFGLLCLIATIKIQIFANIIVSIFGIIISLFGSGRIRKSIIYLVVFFIIIFLIPRNIYSNLLVSTSKLFTESKEVNYKLNDIGSFLQSKELDDETSASGRLERYPLLWEAFKSNPLTGYFNSPTNLDIGPGGHLFWMNKLTTYGIIGFMPFILIFYFYIRLCIRQFDREFSFYYSISILSGIVLGLFKTLAGFDFWLMFFFIIPGVYYLPFLKIKGREIAVQS